MQRVALSLIAFDAGTQIRASIDQQVVSDYADAMTAGAAFPPIVLFHDGNRHYLADGFHRFMAAQRNDWREIDADVRAGTEDDAIWFALGANRQHAKNGLRLTRADKRHAALLAIARWPDRSAGSIAEQIGVDRSFVSALRAEVGDLTTSTPDTVVGRDGKHYPSSGPKRIDAEKVATVEAALRNGTGVSEVASAARMSTRTVQKIREAAGIPEKLDKSREGVAQRRKDIRDMAERGFASRQIAASVGITEEAVKGIAAKEGVVIHADRVLNNTRRHDSTRIVDTIVMDAENLTADVDLIDFSELPKDALARWVDSLTASHKSLAAFIRRLKKEQTSVEAA